ncbi:calcium homeostasis modulator protein 6-like [Sorex araneus]|uniref:calcium homeostasis modulator protein 6-like n=1 Tax=Sorex araneus TaxID=42254 RepID=UPI002433CFFB|nr:calcium homeostasis modulator protein 6-like [Sorex araneus]
METFRRGLDLYLKYRSALGYGLATLLTIGGESIFSKVVFECPCKDTWNLAYGLVFLLVPAAVLLILGYLVRTRTWRLLTNCCKQGCCPESCNTCWLNSCYFLELSCSVFSLPLTWMAVALLEGTYYVCAGSGSSIIAKRLCSTVSVNVTDCMTQMPLVPCKDSELLPELQAFPKVLKAESQMLGWFLIALVIVFFMIGAIVSQCCSPMSFQQRKFWKIYMKQEEETFKNKAENHAKELSQKTVECFFSPSPNEENKILYTPSYKNWEKISSLYTFEKEKNCYSLLHKSAMESVRNNKSKQENTSVLSNRTAGKPKAVQKGRQQKSLWNETRKET